MDEADAVTPGPTRGKLPTGQTTHRKNTQKSKFLLSQTFKWKKIMFFVIPEMPSKTFVMLYKKLPDHFNLVFSCLAFDSSFLWSVPPLELLTFPCHIYHFVIQV